MSPRAGCRQRSSASTPITRPFLDVHLRLEFEEKFLLLQRPPEAAHQLVPLHRSPLQFGREKIEGALSPLLGRIHGHVGVSEQGGPILPVVREHDDADADREIDFMTVNGEGAGHEIDQFFRHHRRSPLVLNGGEEKNKLIAAETRQGIAPTQAAAEALGNGIEQTIAGRVAESVIDIFEAVEVEEKQGEPVRFPLGMRQCPLQAVHEQGAVGQAGRRIEVSEPLNLLLRPLAL